MGPVIALDDDNHDGIVLSSATQTLPEYIKGTPPSIETLRSRFDAAREDPQGNRRKCQMDRDYYDGPKQLNSEVRTILRTRGQPPIYTNRIRPAINGVLGVLEAARSDPQAYPRNPDDEDSADVCTKTLRYIADECNFGDIKQDVAENYLIEGTGAVIVEMDNERIVATQIRWEEFYADPFSRRNDFGDARYMGIAKWTDAEIVRQRYQARIQDIGDPLRTDGVGIGDNYEDRGDEAGGWVNLRRRRVLLVEEYAVEQGQWYRIVYCGAGVLEYGPSPYLDDKRRPCNPIRATSCYVDRDNGRYGPVRDMIPIQDEINASRSRSLSLMNARQIQQSDPNNPPMADADTARAEAARHDGVIPSGWQLVPTSDMTQANILRNQEAKSEIERMGPTPAVLGRQEGASQSGRARLVAQQAGLTELARPLARLTAWELEVLREMWNRARQFWTEPMWVRVTDELKAVEFLQVNEVTGYQQVPQMVPGPDGQPLIDPMTGQPVMQMVQQPIMQNRLAEIDVDIVLDTVADTATLAQETWTELVQLVGQAGGLEAVFNPAFELMIEASPIADKRRLIDMIKKKREEMEKAQAAQAQQQAEAAQVAQQVQLAGVQADIENKQAESAQKLASAHKTAAEADVTQAQLYAGLGINPLEALQT